MRQLSLKSWQVGRPNNNNLIAAPCPFPQHKKVDQQPIEWITREDGYPQTRCHPKIQFLPGNHAAWCTFLIWFRVHSAIGNFCHQEEDGCPSALKITEAMMAITHKFLIRWCFQLTRINFLATVSRPQCLSALQPMEAVLSLFLVHSA